MIINFIDENGNNIEFEILGIELYDGKVYCVCYPTDNSSTEVSIYRVEDVDEDHSAYFFVDDPVIAKKVFDQFKERTKDIYKFV